MLTEPISGYTASLEQPVRVIEFKATINSHNILTSESKDSSVKGDSTNTLFSNFTTTAAFTLRTIDVFISRESGNDSEINVRILADTAGSPDTGTVLASGALFGLQNLRPRWYEINFVAGVSLSSSTPYWVELSFVGDTSIDWYKESTATGFSFGVSTGGPVSVTTDETLILKTTSSTSDDNDFDIDSLLKFNVTPTAKMESESANMELNNNDRKLDEGQPLRHIFKEGIPISFYIGNGDAFLKFKTLLLQDYQFRANKVNVNLFGPNRLLISHDVISKTTYVGQDYAEVIADLIKQGNIGTGNTQFADSGLVADSGLTADSNTAEIQQTGITFPSSGTLEGTIANAIQKILEVTNFEFLYNADGLPVFREKSTDFAPVFTFDNNIHIKDRRINTNHTSKNLINRGLTHNGDFTNDVPLTVATATLQSNITGTILASERTKEFTVTYASAPQFRAEVRDNLSDGDTDTVELIRSQESITFEIENLLFPNNSASFDVSVFSSSISNSDVGFLGVEKAKPVSIKKDGVFDYVRENNLFVTDISIERFLDELLFFNSSSREFFNLNTRGVPILEVGDVVKVSHPDININFIYKIQSFKVVARQFARSVSIRYEVEKFPFLDGESLSGFFQYADSGLIADDGLLADAESRAEQRTYQ